MVAFSDDKINIATIAVFDKLYIVLNNSYDNLNIVITWILRTKSDPGDITGTRGIDAEYMDAALPSQVMQPDGPFMLTPARNLGHRLGQSVMQNSPASRSIRICGPFFAPDSARDRIATRLVLGYKSKSLRQSRRLS
jgi:hypothetical protein